MPLRQLEIFKNIFESAPDPIMILDLRGVILAVNQMTEELSGYDRGELEGKHFSKLKLLTKDSLATTLKEYALLIAGKERSPFELDLVKMDGEPFCVELNPRVIRIEGGGRLIIAQFRDITVRKSAEKMMQVIFDNNLAILEEAPALIWMRANEKKDSWFNKSWLGFTGSKSNKELIRKLPDLIHEEDHRYCSAFAENRVEDIRSATEYRVRFNDGTYHWIHEIVRPFTGIHGEQGGYVGYCFDITERKALELMITESKNELQFLVEERTRELKSSKHDLEEKVVRLTQTEKALRKSEKEYRGLLETASDVIVIFRPEGEIIEDVNEQACRAYGYSKSELIGMSMIELSTDVPKGKQHIADTIEKSGSRFETIHKNRKGELIHFEVTASMTEFKGMQSILSIQRDITQRKRNERALNRRILFEELITTLSTTFINVAVSEIPEEIENTLKSVAEFFRASVASFIVKPGVEFYAVPANHWPRLDAIPDPLIHRFVSHDICPEMWEQLNYKDHLINDFLNPFIDCDMSDFLEKMKSSEVLYIPVRGEKELYGCLRFLRSVTTDAWSSWDLNQLKIVGNILFSARNREVSDRVIQDRTVRLETLHEIDMAILSQLTLGEILDYGLGRIKAQFDNIRAALTLFDFESNSVSLAAVTDIEENPIVAGGQIDLSLFKEILSLQPGEIIHVEDLPSKEPKSAMEVILEEQKIASYILIPLYHGGEELIGSLNVGRFVTGGFSEEDITMISEITYELTLSIEHDRLRRDLAESETRYRNIFEQAIVGLFRISPEEEVLMVNPALLDLLGYDSEEELKARDIRSDIYADQRVREDIIQELREMGRVVGYVCPWKRKDGSIVQVRLNVRSCRDEQKNVLFFEGSVEDITARFRLESELETLKLAVESMDLGLTITDMDGTIIYTNPAEADMHGFDISELIGMNARNLGSGKDKAPKKRSERETYSSYQRESVNIRKDGTLFPVHLMSVLIRDTNSRPVGIITTCEDVTKRREIEATLREKDKLAVVGSIAGGIAHEIKNPLFAISSGVQLLMFSSELDQEQQKTLKIILDESMRMNRLIKQLREFSRPVTAEMTRQDIRELISGVLSFHEGLFRDKKIVASFDAPNSVMVPYHKDSMTQVLINVIQNAVDASSDGGEIQVLLNDGTFKDHVVVQVHDTGVGIEEQAIDKLFDPYFTTKKGNTGMGLAISKKIMVDHEGDIKISSEPGKGTTVYLILPLEDSA